MSIEPASFLKDDYKYKIDYLAAHMTRMWTRFNFFVTLETALLGGKLLLAGGEASPMVGIAGMVLSLVWYVMGAQDRFLMDFYRWQVMEAAGRVKDALGISEKTDSDASEKGKDDQQMILAAAKAAATNHVGGIESKDDELLKRYLAWRKSKIENSLSRWLENLSSWRSKRFSTTHLAAWIPLVALVLWMMYTVIQLIGL
jgi:hypothetical protein